MCAFFVLVVVVLFFAVCLLYFYFLLLFSFFLDACTVSGLPCSVALKLTSMVGQRNKQQHLLLTHLSEAESRQRRYNEEGCFGGRRTDLFFLCVVGVWSGVVFFLVGSRCYYGLFFNVDGCMMMAA